jgi:hypothetical protein
MVVNAMDHNLEFLGVDAVTFTYYWHGENLQLTRMPDESEVKMTGAIRPTWDGVNA